MAKRSNWWFLGITQKLKTFTAKTPVAPSPWSNETPVINVWSEELVTSKTWLKQTAV